MKQPLISRKRIEIFVAVVLVAAYVAIPFALLPRICVPEKIAQPVSYRLVIDGQQSQTSSTDQHKGAVKAPFTTLEGKIQANGSAEPINAAPEYPRSWGLRFWCEVNASDFAIGLFTLFLFIATYFLWRETERLAAGGDDQANKLEQSIRQQRRLVIANLASAKATTAASKAAIHQAKVLMGVELPILKAVSAKTSNDANYEKTAWITNFWGIITIKNYGRTTAFVTECIINAGFDGWQEQPEFQPAYIRLQKYPAMVPIPAGEERPFYTHYIKGSFPEDAIQRFTEKESLLLYGIVHFKDFMGEPHTQEFAFLWVPANKEFMSMTFAEAYNRQT